MDHYGELLIGFLALLVLVNVIIGVYLGWPKSRAAWDWLLARKHRQTPLIGRLRRWHIMTGLISLPVFVVLLISGISMIFHEQTEALLDRPAPPELDVKFEAGKSVQINEWLPAAERHWPDAEWMRISQPTEAMPATGIILKKDDDPRETSGSYMLWLHPQTSEVLAEQDYSGMSVRQKTAFWLFPLHSGEVFAMPGRLLVFICGLLTTILSIVGGWLWYRRKFRQK
jgi:uncharacterized iron-regulated membrane protein